MLEPELVPDGTIAYALLRYRFKTTLQNRLRRLTRAQGWRGAHELVKGLRRIAHLRPIVAVLEDCLDDCAT